MELRQLRYFVEAARVGHFARAAQKLRVAQPSLSQQIKSLEMDLGVELFDRSGRRAVLTQAGQALLVRAERILAEAERASADASEFSGAVRGRVVIGALQSLVEVRLPELLAAFERSYPGVEVALREETTVQMLDLLREGEIDLALGHTTGLRVPGRMVAETLFEEDLVLVMSPGHTLAGREEVPLADLMDETFVSYKEGSGIRAALTEACKAEGFEPRISFECGTLRPLVAAGLGIAVVPRSMTECPGLRVAVAKLKPYLARTVAVFRVEGRYLSPAAEALLACARDHLSDAPRS